MTEHNTINGQGDSHDDSLQPAWAAAAHPSRPMSADVAELAERLSRVVSRDVWHDAHIDRIPIWELSEFAQMMTVLGLCEWFGINGDVNHERALDHLSYAFDDAAETPSLQLPFSFAQFVGRLTLLTFGRRVAAAGLDRAVTQNPEHDLGVQPAEIYAISDLEGYASLMRRAAEYSISEYDTDLRAEQVVGIIRKHCLGFDDEHRPLLDAGRTELIIEGIVGAIASTNAACTSFQTPADECVIHSALVLRDVIARAPSVLQSLGSYQVFVCDDELKTRYDFLSDEEVPSTLYSDAQLAVSAYLGACAGAGTPSFMSQSSLPAELNGCRVTIRLPECHADAPLDGVSIDLLRRMYEAASPATFGDMRSMETRVDPLVRSGREIDAAGFSVTPHVCDWVARTWAEHFHPKKVRVEPYKINLYGPGDRFATHRDTPARNLVGTFLIALSGWGPPCVGGGLAVHDTGGSHRWDGASGWASFMPHLPHEVQPVSTGARVTIAFKVFADGDPPADDTAGFNEDELSEAAENIRLCCNEHGQVGVLLAFAYSLIGNALCGRDLFVYRALQRLGPVESVPVAVHVSGEAPADDATYWFAKASVYALSQDNLARIAAGDNTHTSLEAGQAAIPFISTARGYELYSNNTASQEWTGNSAEPANVDTLYVHRALIATLKPETQRATFCSVGIDLRKVDLSGRDFRGANLEESGFEKANLVGTKLQRANLAYSGFSDAVLTRTQLQHADLTGALLRSAKLDRANLTGATLRGADLKGADLKGTVLTNVAWDYETTWPEGFDPLEHGAPMPIELAHLAAQQQYPDPEGTITNSLGMKFVPISSGTFLMGTPGDEGEEFPHQVRITKPFCLGMHQVTQAQYEKVVGENPSLSKAPDLPVEHLSWKAAARFCELLSALPDEQQAGRRYRLPTEAEWEYACRAGTSTAFHTGDSLKSHQAHFAATKRSTAKHTMPVGSFPPNAWGLYNMHGNVWEWTNDWFSADYFRHSPVDDPQGPATGTHHTLRGGSASMKSLECRSAFRGESSAVDGPETEAQQRIAFYGDFGMRVVCVMDMHDQRSM